MQEHSWDNRIYYRVNELKADQITLVFVHGVSGSSSAWWPYEKIFENKYNVLTYDIRGHGLSKKYPNYKDYKIENFVQDLQGLVNHLGIKKFVLISNSFGGLIHEEYLKVYRDRVAANIFTSPEIFLNKTTLIKWGKPILAILTTILRILPCSLKPRGHVDYSKYKNSTDWSIGRNWADMSNTGFRAHFFTLRQSMKVVGNYEFEKINIPTLVMHGENDTMVPIKNSMEIARQIKNAKFMEISGVDHNTAHNAVREMSELIETFLTENQSKILGSEPAV